MARSRSRRLGRIWSRRRRWRRCQTRRWFTGYEQDTVTGEEASRYSSFLQPYPLPTVTQLPILHMKQSQSVSLTFYFSPLFTESAPRPIQSISCDVCTPFWMLVPLQRNPAYGRPLNQLMCADSSTLPVFQPVLKQALVSTICM